MNYTIRHLENGRWAVLANELVIHVAHSDDECVEWLRKSGHLTKSTDNDAKMLGRAIGILGVF